MNLTCAFGIKFISARFKSLFRFKWSSRPTCFSCFPSPSSELLSSTRCLSSIHSKDFQKYPHATGNKFESMSSTAKFNMNNHLYSINVNSCSEMYMSWYEKGITRNKPLRGVDFEVVYFDNMPKASSGVPVILALHGSASSHTSFSPLMPYFTEMGVRVIIPNFPGAGYTAVDKDRAFTHSDQERACFIFDFLSCINISKVHILLIHSGGIYPGVYLMERLEMFRSIVMLNPGGHKPSKVLGMPTSVIHSFVGLMDYSWFRRLMLWTRPLLRRIAPGVKITEEQQEVAIRTALLNNFNFVEESLRGIALQRIPRILAYSTNDRVVYQTILQELVEILLFPADSIYHYNADGQKIESGVQQTNELEVKQTGDKMAKCFIFEQGAHFVLNQYPEIISEAIYELLECVAGNMAYNRPFHKL